MEQSGNIWSLTVLQLGGADLTLFEALLFVLAIGGAVYLMRRLHEKQEQESGATQTATENTLEAKLTQMAQAQAASQIGRASCRERV